MKKMLLYTFVSGCLSLMLSSCGTYFSVGGGYGGPVAVYDDGYNVGYSSTYGRLGYEEARREALFLSDKMAYELGLSDVQYEAVYEINLDYLLNMQGERSLYGDYWARRNSDMFYVLNARQYNYYISEDYFYRPVYWYNNSYAYRFIIVMLTAATITVHVRQIITPIVEGAIGIQKAIMQDVLEPVGIHLL